MKMRKSLALTALTTVLLCVLSLTFFASAQETEGIYTYDVTSGEAVISKCDTSASGEIVIPDTLGGYPVVSIGFYAFKDCNEITSVTIPESVRVINEGGFRDCKGLTTVTLSESLKTIRASAFSGCTNLTDITIPEGVTNIERAAFVDCAGLTSVTISGSVTSIGDLAFGRCTALTNINVVESNPNYASTDGVLFNKDKTTLILCPIGNERTEYTIPDGVTNISCDAFYGCSGLTTISIPNSLTNISENAFYNCTSLTDIAIPGSVKNIGEQAFFNCNNLSGVTIESGVTSINYRAFSGCLKLENIIIPDSVTSIGNNTFSSCTNLKSVKLSKNIKLISDNMFWSCMKLTDVIIPDGVTSIGKSAFQDCSNLKSIDIPNSVTSISDYAFRGCSYTRSITISGKIEAIGIQVFSGCMYVTKISIPDGVTSIGERAFEDMRNLTSVSIPNSVTSIGQYAFYRCDELKCVNIPDNVTNIEDYAFGFNDGNTKIDGFKIQGYKDSAAETYANDNGFEFTDLTPHEHSFTLKEVITEPTCTQAGSENYTCDCGEIQTREIAPKGHQSSDWIIDKEAGITNSGSKHIECTVCGAIIETAFIPAKSNLSAEYEDGILSIYGSGDLPSSNSTQWHDWDEYREDVKTIVIDGEIGTIGSYSFESYPLLSCVIINTDSIIIEPQAFVNCKDLVNIIIFGNSEIDSASFVLSSPSLQIFKDSLCVHKPQEADTYYSTVNYSYNGSELHFSGDAKFTSYKFFDSMSAFCSKMSNIEKLKFTSISFDDMPIYYIPEGGASLKQFENNTLKNGEMYPLTQNHQTITFNALIDGMYDESIKHFYLVSTDESQSNVKDTEIKLADSIKEIVARALRWIVTLLNKLFALFKRFK